MKVLNLLDFRFAIRAGEMKPGVILLASALLLTLHKYFGSSQFLTKTYAGLTDYYAATIMFISAFILLGILPLLMISFLFKDSLKEYGLQMGDWRSGFTSIFWLFPIISILMLYPSSNTQEMIVYYPLDKEAGASVFKFFRFEIIRVAFFYTAWEFFFRGFMLFGLRKYVGDWLAICIQTIPSCLWHIGLPAGEIFASIFGGILFGVMALKTNSILYPFILHFLIGVTLDLLIVIQY